MNIFEELQERQLLSQMSHPQLLSQQLSQGGLTFYLGIDPTATSLHCGHLVPLLLARRLQAAGHRPLILVGGGTAMIGDPSGRDTQRQLLSVEQIEANVTALKKQIARFINFDHQAALLLDNSSWLQPLNYIDFLRDIGRHFSVNRMLSFETYKNRLESGLSFIEFNYQLLQSYDFLVLKQRYNCSLQIGGDDQWGNMVAGVELIRRVEQAESQALTVPLITRSDGKKMGKSEKGAIYLDPTLTSAYDFYQYWRNSADADIERFLLIYTDLSVEKCRELGALQGQEINEAKKVLAWQLCALVHGEETANEVAEAAQAGFSGTGQRQAIPGALLTHKELAEGIEALTLFCQAGLVKSRREARRLFEQGGAFINGVCYKEPDKIVSLLDLHNAGQGEELLLRAGKKRLFRYSVCS